MLVHVQEVIMQQNPGHDARMHTECVGALDEGDRLS